MVYSTRRFVLCLTLCYFVLAFSSPYSLAITSLGEERANLIAFRTFVRFALVWFCLFPLPLGVWEGMRFVIVALLRLFSYLLLSKPQWILTFNKLDMCIDNKEVWFGIANGQVSSIFDRVICPGFIVSRFIYIVNCMENKHKINTGHYGDFFYYSTSKVKFRIRRITVLLFVCCCFFFFFFFFVVFFFFFFFSKILSLNKWGQLPGLFFFSRQTIYHMQTETRQGL